MKRTFFVFAVLSVFLSGCGLSGAERQSKNEALEIEKAGVLVVKDRVVVRGAGCHLILEGGHNTEKRWVVIFSSETSPDCIRLVSKDKVKATFVERGVSENRHNTGDWLSMELIFE